MVKCRKKRKKERKAEKVRDELPKCKRKRMKRVKMLEEIAIFSEKVINNAISFSFVLFFFFFPFFLHFLFSFSLFFLCFNALNVTFCTLHSTRLIMSNSVCMHTSKKKRRNHVSSVFWLFLWR